MLLDEREVLLSVEVLHDDDGAADALHGTAEAQRGCVVERCRREVHGRLVDAEQQLAERGDAVGALPEGRTGQWHLDALGTTRGARAVEHVLPLDARVLQRGGRLRREGGFVAVESVDGAVEHEPHLHDGHRVAQLGRLAGLVRGGDERLRTAVVDDVRHLVGGEP